MEDADRLRCILPGIRSEPHITGSDFHYAGAMDGETAGPFPGTDEHCTGQQLSGHSTIYAFS